MTCASTPQHTDAVRRALAGGVQRKVTVGDARDPAEVEADRVADRVMRAPAEEEREEEVQRAPVDEQREDELQRVVSPGGIDDGRMTEAMLSEPEPQQGAVELPAEPTGQEPALGPAPEIPSTFGGESLAVEPPEGLDELDILARAAVGDALDGAADGGAADGEGEEGAAHSAPSSGGEGGAGSTDTAADPGGSTGGGDVVQRHPTADAAPPTTPFDLEALRDPSGGEPVPDQVRRRVEPTLGADLSHVRVHRGPQAAERAAALRARAFTLGSHVWLGAGASITDTRLMAHELTHVVQQDAAPVRVRGPPTVPPSPTPSDGRRAVRACRERVAVRERGAPSVVRGGFFSDAADWVGGKLSDAADWVGDSVEAALDFAKEKVAAFADGLPGYRVLGFVLGADPITGDRIARTGETLIWALRPILPGGLLDQLQESNAANEVVTGIGDAISELVAQVGSIGDLMRRTWDALSIRASIAENWERVKDVWAPTFRAVRRFVVRVGKIILRAVFEAVVLAAGSAGQQVVGMVRRAGSVIGAIVAHPGRFLSNLIDAVRGGFGRFFRNIGTHLRQGFFAWLTGAMDAAGITLPERWNLAGIAHLGMQLIGLTWANIRRRLVRQLRPNGERKVALLEKTVEVARRIVEGGLPAIIDMVRDRITGLVDQLRDAVVQYISLAVAKEAAKYAAGLFTGGLGTLIQLAKKIYDVVAWVVDNLERMRAVVTTIGDSLTRIVRGDLDPAAKAVERTLASFVPMLISLFAQLVGLGGLPAKIRKLVKKLSAPVNRAVDWLVRKVLKLGRALLQRARSAASAAIGWFRRRTPFGEGRHRHTLVWQGTPKAPQLMVRSEPKSFDEWLAKQQPPGAELPPAADQLVTRVRSAKNDLDKEIAEAKKRPADDGSKIERREEQLAAELGRLQAFMARASTVPDTRVEYGSPRMISVGDATVPVATTMVASPLTVGGPSGSTVRNPSVLWEALRRRPEGGRTFWIQGHMLNNNLHGPGDDPRNLTPISQSANAEHERKVESEVKDTVLTPVEAGGEQIWPKVQYEVEATYETKPLPAGAATAPAEVEQTLKAEGQLASKLTCTAFHLKSDDGGGWTKDTNRSPIVPTTEIPNDKPMTVFELGERQAAAPAWYVTDANNGEQIVRVAGIPDEAGLAEVQGAIRAAAAGAWTWAGFEVALVTELAGADVVPEPRRAPLAADIRAALEADDSCRLFSRGDR